MKVDPKLGGKWNVKEKPHIHFFPLSPQQTYFNLQFIFSFDLELLLYHGDRLLFTPFLPFPRSMNYDRAF